ncbi:hypothetical protein LZ31DRAFT_538567 [Colletotrichum somersetense]|nr:hypothetical protein LZ31DRAFT_538567 [Colletotrichum somersetense]
MKAVSVVFFASVAAAAVIDFGLAASRDTFARHLGSATSGSVFVERDDDDAAFEDFSLKERDEIDDLIARNVETTKAIRESVPLHARDDAAATKGGISSDDGKAPDAKKNTGKADGKSTDAKKNTGKADGKSTDAKKNTGKADGKSTDAKKNTGKADGKTTDAKKNAGKADGKANDAKKNSGKADGKATDAKKNTGKADGKATDGKKNNGTAADDGKSKKNDAEEDARHYEQKGPLQFIVVKSRPKPYRKGVVELVREDDRLAEDVDMALDFLGLFIVCTDDIQELAVFNGLLILQDKKSGGIVRR